MAVDVFLETTGVVDLLFRGEHLRKKVRTAAGSGNRLHTSRYVIYELARGFLSHLLTLHNKASDLDTMAELIRYATVRTIGGQYAGRTMLGAYSDFSDYLAGLGISLDEHQRLLHFRAWIGPHLRIAWQKLNTPAGDIASIKNPAQCLPALPSPQPLAIPGKGRPREHLFHDLPIKTKCGQPSHCGLMAFIQSVRAEFSAMLEALEHQSGPDDETARRIGALRRLLAVDASQPFKGRDCHACGDAIIAAEVPPGNVLATKNDKHLAPLCAALGRPRPITWREASAS